MDISKYPPSTQLNRAFEILRVLFAAGPLGLPPAALVKATNLPASYITQQLGQLANLDVVEEVGESGHWRPGLRWARMAMSLSTSITRDLDALQEYQQRVTRAH